MNWNTEYDDNDNTIHEAASAVGDSEDGAFYYRIAPVLFADKIQWENRSDAEVCTSDLGPWDDVATAKADLEKADKEWAESLSKEDA